MRRSPLGWAILTGLSIAATAQAVPGAKLHVSRSTDAAARETWQIIDDAFDFWVLGDVDRSAAIDGVNLAASFYGTGAAAVDESGATPRRGVASDAGGAVTSAQALWGLGDLGDNPDAIGDDSNAGATGVPDADEINVYRVEIAGYDGARSDALGHALSGGRLKMRARSARGAGGTNPVPEPATMALLGASLIGVAASRLSRRPRERSNRRTRNNA